MWYWQKNIQIDQWDRIGSPETDPQQVLANCSLTKRQRKSSQQMTLEQLDIHMWGKKNKEYSHRPYTLHKNLIKVDHKLKYKTIRFLEDNLF